MNQETFKNLDLEKKMEIYNQWLYDSKLEQYELYTNDDEGIELCIGRAFSSMCSNVDIANELAHSTHYDTTDRLIMHDRDIPYGFKSLTDSEIKERFENKDFLDYLDGLKG